MAGHYHLDEQLQPYEVCCYKGLAGGGEKPDAYSWQMIL